MIINRKQKILFNIINILGTSKNYKCYKNVYLNHLSSIKIFNSILILRIKNLFLLAKVKIFNLFFFNFIKEYYLGSTLYFKFFNSLKNNFKLFFYLLYKNLLLSSNLTITCNLSSPIRLNLNTSISNTYYPYYSSDLNLNNSFYYNLIFKDIFTLSNFSLLYKFNNYTYLRSKKQKKFKHKEFEKLDSLRYDLCTLKENPFRLKFYYKYFEHTKLHSYWNKEAFLKKKFKYFNPYSSSIFLGYNNKQTNLYLLHFFYKYRKYRKFTNKYLLFKRKRFINFWLQSKIKRFKLFSYKVQFQNKKTLLKYSQFYLNSIYNIYKSSFNIKKLDLLSLYRKYLFNFKKIKGRIFLQFCNNFKLYKSSNNLLILDNFLSRYKKLKDSFKKKNYYLFSVYKKKIKNFKRFNIPSTSFWNKNKDIQLFNLKINNLTKVFLLNYFKKNKAFRIKFKYIQWLNTQKILKSWKFNKFLSFKKLNSKHIKNSIYDYNLYMFSNKIKMNKLNYFNIISSANSSINLWSNFNNNLLPLKKLKIFSSLVDVIELSTNKYLKSFSFYKSNKALNLKYAYWNIFKDYNFNFNLIKLKKKNFLNLNNLSKALFKYSWLYIKNKNFLFFKNKGFYNIVPISNYLFIKKVILLYKKLFISKLLFSNIFYKNSLYKTNSYTNNYKYINIINTINNIRSIDKKFGLKKRKERDLFNQLNKYKKIKNLLTSRLKKLECFTSTDKKAHSLINSTISKYNIRFKLFHFKKIINKLKLSLKKLSTTTLNKNIFLHPSLKVVNIKKSSFFNFLHPFLKKKKKVLNYFLDLVHLNNNKNLVNYLGFNSFYLNKNNLNSNKLRLLRFTKSLKFWDFFILLKKNKKLLNSLVLNKFKQTNALKSNWGLTFLLRKNYFIFLKLFKYFSFYKSSNKDYSLGFGRLSNYLNINNENIFSLCNFFMYNFLDYTSGEKYNLFSLANNYLTYSKQNLYILKYLKYKPIDFKQEHNLFSISFTTRKKTSISLESTYDILEKQPLFFSTIFDSKHFMIKYKSLLLTNSLLAIYAKGSLNFFLNTNINTYTKYNILKLNNLDISLINWYLHTSSATSVVYRSNNYLKNLYFGLLIKFNNI